MFLLKWYCFIVEENNERVELKWLVAHVARFFFTLQMLLILGLLCCISPTSVALTFY